MAGRVKHMQRSHRSYHNPKPFAQFQHRANIKTAQRVTKLSLMDRAKKMLKNAFKKVFHKTQSK